jgi:hypothetical protein
MDDSRARQARSAFVPAGALTKIETQKICREKSDPHANGIGSTTALPLSGLDIPNFGTIFVGP